MGEIRRHNTLPDLLPARLRNRNVELYGVQGSTWWEQLPGLLKYCEQRWLLELKAPYQNLSYNYVAPAVGPGGARWVLKAGFPNPELVAEIETLQIFAGQGAVQLIQADPGLGLLLLEELIPSTPLASLEDDRQATSVAAGLMQQIRRPPPEQHHFRTIASWFSGLKRLRSHFDGGSGPFPLELVELAEELSGELLSSSRQEMLLHGDLHQNNILAGRRQPWLAIDPKGVTGDPAYEPSVFIYNPIPQLMQSPDPKAVIKKRVEQFSEELQLERWRVAGWAFAQAVLSAWWSYEDHEDSWEYFIACAEAIRVII
jgi:streptomycin 6-kinase